MKSTFQWKYIVIAVILVTQLAQALVEKEIPKPDSFRVISISSPQINQINLPDSLSIKMKGQSAKSVNWEIIVAAIISVVGVGATVISNKVRERNNIIRQARIAWIQDLRKNLSLLPIEAEKISLNFGILMTTKLEVLKDNPEETHRLILEFINNNIETLAKIEGYCHLVILHLNPRRTEARINDHIKLEGLVKKLSASVSYEGLYEERVSLTGLCSEIIEESRVVIKNAWEDAKS